MQLTALSEFALSQLAMIQLSHWSLPAAEDSLVAAFRAFSEPAATMAVTSVWQGAAVACCLAICLRVAPRTSAEHRFAIWIAAFVTLVSLPFLAFISSFPTAVAASASYASSATAVRPWLNIDARWSLVIAALWATATLVRAADLVVHSFRLRKMWKSAVPINLEGRLNGKLASVWARGPVEVCTTTMLQRPAVIGFIKPRILMPDWLFARLTPGELEQIVLHEAEHLRRRDDWTNLFQKFCLVLFPLNPALVWIERRLCREREMACDDGVVRTTHAPRAYAACLASLAERGLQHRAEALSLGAWQRRPELVHRVHSILRRKHTLRPFATRALLGALGCGLVAGSIELARCPQLIAFVPAGSVLAAQAQQQPLIAGYVPAQVVANEAASSTLKGQGIAPSHPSNGRPMVSAGSLPATASISKQDVALEWKASASESANHSPRPVMLKAIIPSEGSKPARNHEQPSQQWIVLTTWEQVQSPNINAGLIADYETAAKQNASSNQNTQTQTQPAGQVFVTRLILRMFPASSLSAQPTSVPVQSGWFVIQL